MGRAAQGGRGRQGQDAERDGPATSREHPAGTQVLQNEKVELVQAAVRVLGRGAEHCPASQPSTHLS